MSEPHKCNLQTLFATPSAQHIPFDGSSVFRNKEFPRITKIELTRDLKRVYVIYVHYSSGPGHIFGLNQLYGHPCYIKTTIDLDEDEYVIHFSSHYQFCLLGVTIKTNKRTYGPLGLGYQGLDYYECRAPEGYALRYLKGWTAADLVITTIQCAFGPASYLTKAPPSDLEAASKKKQASSRCDKNAKNLDPKLKNDGKNDHESEKSKAKSSEPTSTKPENESKSTSSQSENEQKSSSK